MSDCRIELLNTFQCIRVQDKILLSTAPGGGNKMEVTNDGATILKSIGIDNPAAKILVGMCHTPHVIATPSPVTPLAPPLVDISKVQDAEVGDGTTSVVVLAAELLREAESLVARKLHPQTIIAGWRLATDCARDALTAVTKDNRFVA